MRVTRIEELSRSRYKVYVDDSFAFVLYKGELRLYHIKEGEELRTEDYRTIMQEVLPKRAKLRAMNLLQGREYTTSQLRTKLQQGYYPPEIIEQAIEYVAGFHYIDDLRYAVDYITYHENSRSRRRIEQDLQGKGISVVGDILDLAANINVINKSGAWYAYEGNKIGQGRENAKQYLKDNPAVCDEIAEKVREHYGLKADVSATAEKEE